MNFFFSSRRRHTRLVSDWSSDVCSSDLRGRGNKCYARRAATTRGSRSRHLARRGAPPNLPARSEERRVGKECRARCAQAPLKQMSDRVTEAFIQTMMVIVATQVVRLLLL